MKRITLYFLMSFLTPFAAQAASELQGCYSDQAHKSTQSCYRDMERKLMGTGVTRKNSDLLISLKNGTTKKLSDECAYSNDAGFAKCMSDGDTVPFYTYLRYVPSISQHMISVIDSLESESILMVDAYNGNEVNLRDDDMLFSPDKKSFVSTPFSRWGAPYRIEIWTRTDQGLVNQFSIDAPWAARDSTWVRPDLIEMTQLCPVPMANSQDDPDNPYDLVPNGKAKLSMANGKWTLQAAVCPPTN